MPSLSQRYRPQRFADVTGQQHITETLRKEVATGRLGHAYLFSGPRGVGKTTSARIFAKALNCLDPKEGEPCNVCATCLSANQGNALDIIELDAATHTGVDTVREAIIEHVRFAPMQAKRKVYILDEAHMLSSSSWNALLKTLEEPPAYAFFLLATTEIHKVPATIISRCQRFEFRRIEDGMLGARVEDLAKAEGWNIDPEVTRLIVSRSEGCVRDAETLLGQLGSLGETHLTLDLASLVIPPRHISVAAELMTTWADRDHAKGLQQSQKRFEEGIPLLPLFEDLLWIVRQLLTASGNPGLREAWESSAEERLLIPLIDRFSPAELNDMALLLMERRKDMKAGIDPFFALQLASTTVACGLLRHSEGSLKSSAPKTPTPPPATRTLASATPVAVPTATSSAIGPLSPTSSESSLTSTMDEVVAEPIVTVSMPSVSEEIVSEAVEASPVTASVSEASAFGLDLNTVRAKWNALIRLVDEKNHSLPFILKISRPEEILGDVIRIRFQYSFHHDKVVADLKNKRLMEECLRSLFNHPTLTIDGMVGEDQEQKEQRSQDVVSNILKAFGGTIVE